MSHTHTHTHTHTHHTHTHTHTNTEFPTYRRKLRNRTDEESSIHGDWTRSTASYLVCKRGTDDPIPSHRCGSLLGLKVNYTSLEMSTVTHFLLRIF